MLNLVELDHPAFDDMYYTFFNNSYATEKEFHSEFLEGITLKLTRISKEFNMAVAWITGDLDKLIEASDYLEVDGNVCINGKQIIMSAKSFLNLVSRF